MGPEDKHGESASKVLTLQLRPTASESLKPQELIQIKGHADLTLNARRAITLLWHNAHRQGIAVGKDYSIEIDELKADKHKGYDVVKDAVESLMRTLLIVRLPNGKDRRVQFLGGNDMDAEDRPAGVLTYSFDKRLVEILERSNIWGQVALPVIMACTSKYAISLYEHIAQKANLSLVTSHTYTVDEFREMVGVGDKLYPAYGDLNRHVIKPAVAEINALASFQLVALPIKQGKRVGKIAFSWHRKDEAAMKAAYQELQRPKLGRRSRAAESTQMVLDLKPSSERIARRGRIARSPETS